MDVRYVTLALFSTTLGCGPTGTVPDGSVPDGSVGRVCLTAKAKAPELDQGAMCPILICGDNAPNAGDGLLFDELNLRGLPNYAGVSLDASRGTSRTGRPLSATLPGDPARPRLASINIEPGPLNPAFRLDRLEVTEESTGAAFSGTALIGTVIRFRHTSGTAFEVRVACYNDTVVPFRSQPPGFVRVYDFQARRLPVAHPQDPEMDWFEVCNQPQFIPDLTWTEPHHAVVYRGDRYTRFDGVTPGKTAMPVNAATMDWAFIGCNGSTGSKMHLFRHTHAGGMDDPDKRTTLLKAITSDYCGTGHPTFTVPGHPLAWEIDDGSISDPNPRRPGARIEALWGPRGALCIESPRYADRSIIEGPISSIGGGCGHGFDTCHLGTTVLPIDWSRTGTHSGGHVATVNP